MAKRSDLATKLLNLTEDRTTTTIPSFMEMMIPLMSIMMFSGAGEGIEKMLGIGGKGGGLLPSGDMMANQGKVQNAASSIVGDIRGPAGMSMLGKNTITPEMILRIMTMMSGMGGGIGPGL